MGNFLKANAFVAWIGLVVGLAALFPEWGGEGGRLPVDWLGRAGVFLVFFNQGVTLPAETLRKGLLDWRLHGLVQLSTYLMFPLMTAAGLWMTASFFDQPDVRGGFLFLAFLPTTVTSAVALTSVAGGNVSGALFNCTLSSVIGVFLAPLCCVVFMGAGGGAEQVGAAGMLLPISMTILLPLALGQLLRPTLKECFGRHKTMVRRFNTGVILFIVWGAFCQSFLRQVWSRVSGLELSLTMVGVLALLFAASGIVWWLSGALGVPCESRIAALYCGTQKSLAMGLPMSALIFGAVQEVELSLLLLPLLMYHPTQLMLGGLLASRFRIGITPRRRCRPHVS